MIPPPRIFEPYLNILDQTGTPKHPSSVTPVKGMQSRKIVGCSHSRLGNFVVWETLKLFGVVKSLKHDEGGGLKIHVYSRHKVHTWQVYICMNFYELDIHSYITGLLRC